MKIAFDIDAVLADFLSEFLLWRNDRFNTRWRRSDFWSYQWWEVFAEKPEVMNNILFDFFNSREIHRISPMPGAKRGIRKLKRRGHHMCVITSRPRLISEITQEWLDKHFKDAFEMIYFSNAPQWESFGPSKGEIANSWGADILIDDQIKFCHEAGKFGIPSLLFDNPWNEKDELPENIYRVVTWGDIVRIIKEIEG
jgi:5'(3')-deoxyribonucleotidase